MVMHFCFGVNVCSDLIYGVSSILYLGMDMENVDYFLHHSKSTILQLELLITSSFLANLF